jgi:hypothetical protein
MQYMSNWEDADGSMTQRGVDTILGPARAGEWWHLDYRPGKCEEHKTWKSNQCTCDKGERLLGSMFTVVMPQDHVSGSLVPGKMGISTNSDRRSIRQGSMTHFGLSGDGSVDACTVRVFRQQFTLEDAHWFPKVAPLEVLARVGSMTFLSGVSSS